MVHTSSQRISFTFFTFRDDTSTGRVQNILTRSFPKNINFLMTSGRASFFFQVSIAFVSEKKLSVVEITATKREFGVPNIKFVGTIHGNEPVGREIILHFLEFLYENYPTNPKVKFLLENTKISVLPNFNPDGFEMAGEDICSNDHGRMNGDGAMKVDLNRNFPDFYHKNLIPEASETKALRKWMAEVPFILSAALHGGALVANYPFDTVKKFSKFCICDSIYSL